MTDRPEKKHPNLIIEYLTDNPEDQMLCQMYWKRDKDGQEYTHKSRDVAEKFGYRPGQLQHVLPKLCRAYFAENVCQTCRKVLRYVSSRSAATPAIETICDECCKKGKEEKRQAGKVEKEQLMQRAFDSGKYESLPDLEYSFLIALAKTDGGLKPVCRELGIAHELGVKLLNKFHEMHLVNWGSDGFYFLQEVQVVYAGQPRKKRTKPVFGSKKALALYRVLKRRHLFVFPEIPICAFIDMKDVSHLFTESWHSGYFLMARIDFVVCDRSGDVRFGLEYQGGYHGSSDQIKKDAFKRKLLNEVGVPLNHIDATILKKLEGGGGL